MPERFLLQYVRNWRIFCYDVKLQNYSTEYVFFFPPDISVASIVQIS